MLVTLPTRTDVLVDNFGLPRFWAAVWRIYYGGNLAPSYLRNKLRFIESLYVHAEGLGSDLDDALSAIDFDVLSVLLDSFFVSLRNVPVPVNSDVNRWNTAFHFVKDTCERLERNPSVGKNMASIRDRMARLDNLYLGLRPYKRRTKPEIRSLPRSVLMEVLEAARPGSASNPFEYEETQWRAYVIVVLLFFQGLRVGELASLPADFVKSEVDDRIGTRRWFMQVKSDRSEDDPRYSRPSIKTATSIRTIPMTAQTAKIMQSYAENFRGKPNCIQFVVSMHRKPMSVEGIRRTLLRLSNALSNDARNQLFVQTGASQLTAHAFRHTSAVVRMKQWTAAGQSPEQTMAHMRSFFGWSRTSLMPMLYAKAAMDERLNETWLEQLDDRVDVLRNLPT